MTRARASLTLLAGLLLLVSGCATASYLPQIGARNDRVDAFDRATSNGEELILFYRVATYKGSGRLGRTAVAGDITKWSRVNLRELTWTPLSPEEPVGGARRIALAIEDGRPPDLGAGYTEVPILTTPPTLHRSSEIVPQLLLQAEPHPLSLHQSIVPEGRVPTRLVLVRRDGAFQMQAVSFEMPYRETSAWWAVPARIGAAPFILIGDVLLSPFYLVCKLGDCDL